MTYTLELLHNRRTQSVTVVRCTLYTTTVTNVHDLLLDATLMAAWLLIVEHCVPFKLALHWHAAPTIRSVVLKVVLDFPSAPLASAPLQLGLLYLVQPIAQRWARVRAARS
jgi:hypothetical protein